MKEEAWDRRVMKIEDYDVNDWVAGIVAVELSEHSELNEENLKLDDESFFEVLE